MNTQDAAKNVGTLTLGLELKDLPEILAGLEQVKVAAQEAAAAVASIGAPVAAMHGIELVANQTPALILAELRGLRADLLALREIADATGPVMRAYV